MDCVCEFSSEEEGGGEEDTEATEVEEEETVVLVEDGVCGVPEEEDRVADPVEFEE